LAEISVLDSPPTHRCAQFGPFQADLANKALHRRGLRLRVQDKPFQILELLLERPGEVVSRETLQARLWPSGTYVDFDKGLNTAIKKLRQALGDSAGTPIYVETLPRRGYRFLAPVVFNGHEQVQVRQYQVDFCTAEEKSPLRRVGVADEPRANGESDGRTPDRRRQAAVAVVILLTIVIIVTLMRRPQPTIVASSDPDLLNFQMAQITHDGDVRFATISPDGRLIAYTLRNGIGQSLWIRDLTTNVDTEILEQDTVSIAGIAFSPDGRYLYFPRSERLNPVFGYMCRMPVHGGAVEQLIRDADSTPSFSPDGKRFVYTRGYPSRNVTDVRIAYADGSDDHLLKTLAGHQVFDAGATWSPDGRVIAAPIQKVGESRFALYEIATSDAKTEEIFSSPASIGRPVWMDDEKSFLVTLEDHRTRRGQIWMMSPRGGRARRMTNDLSDYSSAISVSADRRKILTMVNGASSNLWWADAKDLSALRQATIKRSIFGVRTAPDGRLLTVGDGIFISNADGSNSTRISEQRDLGSIESCGSYAVAQVYTGTTWSLQRFGIESSVPTALASGDVQFPACSPDGSYVFYLNFDHPERIHRIGVDGSAPSIVAQVQGDTYFGPIAVSPDGRMLAYSYQQFSPPQVKMVILSLADGAMISKFDAHGYWWSAIHWSVDGRAVEYVMSLDGSDNLWSQRLIGGKPTQITHFASGEIFDFAWTQDAKKLFLARGRTTKDIVVMSDARLTNSANQQ